MHTKKASSLDPKILGRLLVMQSMVINLPDEESIFSFICRGLADMPGVARVRHATRPEEITDESAARFPLLRGETYWGELLLTFSDPSAFEPYSAYLNNFCFMVAVILEERNQRQMNEDHKAVLERRVEERTADLLETNRMLDSQIEERKSVEEELQLKNRDLETIASTISSTTTDLNLQVILDKALKSAIKLTGTEGGTLCLVERKKQTLVLSASYNASQAMVEDLSAQAVKIGDCLCGKAAQTGEPFILWDNASGSQYATLEAVRNEGIRFHAAFPLMARGSATGVLCIFSRTPVKPSEHSLKLVEDLCGPIALAIENARLFEAVQKELMERRRVEDRLEKSKALLQKVFDGISEPLILFGKDGRVRMLNKATRQYYNIAEEDFTFGKYCFEAFRGNTGGPCERCKRPFSEIRGFTGIFERENAGHPGVIEQIAVYSVADEKGEEDGTIIRIRDITEAKLMERQSIQNEKLASIGLLASGIAHEINNPNNFITFNIPILRDYLSELMPVVCEYSKAHPEFEIFGMSFPTFERDVFRLLDNMEHGAGRITATVSRLKNFVSKSDDGLQRLIDLKQVAEQAIEICRTEIRKRVKSFEVDISKDLPPLRTDPVAIEQVLVNLLINASHASDKEDSWIHLKIRRSRRASEHSVIELADNGCGMDKAVREKIFDPFFTTKGHMQGTGLGLYVCHNLIAGLGGRIEVESESGKGSTFRIVLRDAKQQS